MRARRAYQLAAPLLRPLHARARARVFRRGRDATAELTSGDAVVIAAHPDDDVLGCGATIMRTRQAGYRVRLVVASDGGASHPARDIEPAALAALRRQEALEAARIMGIPADHVLFLDHADGALATVEERLAGELASVIEAASPARLFVTSRLDAHPDHQAVARAAEAARRRLGGDIRLFEYPVWYWKHLPWVRRPDHLGEAARYLVADSFGEWRRAPALLVRTDGLLERKRQALAAHRSQLEGLPGQTSELVLTPEFVAHFFRESEAFFEVPA